MTRFARKGGVTEKKESKKKKEEGTEWSTMFKAPETAVESEIIESEFVKKRKHEEILDKKINEEKSENGVAIAPASTKIRDRETLLKTHGKYIDNEVLADLDEMLATKKITETEYADSIIREGRSNRRRLDRKNERDSAIVCFKCRKSGHCIDECPEVKDDCEQGTGICYKCGSTEHSVNKCKARVEAGTYPYATCFICKEQGHISKQCPDNPRGLYPNGNFIIEYNFLF
jgi:zinc finger CCHC domain-containing protein 9